jgi:hypothetical protein
MRMDCQGENCLGKSPGLQVQIEDLHFKRRILGGDSKNETSGKSQ